MKFVSSVVIWVLELLPPWILKLTAYNLVICTNLILIRFVYLIIKNPLNIGMIIKGIFKLI